MALAKARRGMETRLWELFAYCARYGSQQLPVLQEMTLDDLSTLTNELSRIVAAEHPETDL
jgi:hypothetical protein